MTYSEHFRSCRVSVCPCGSRRQGSARQVEIAACSNCRLLKSTGARRSSSTACAVVYEGHDCVSYSDL